MRVCLTIVSNHVYYRNKLDKYYYLCNQCKAMFACF